MFFSQVSAKRLADAFAEGEPDFSAGATENHRHRGSLYFTRFTGAHNLKLVLLVFKSGRDVYLAVLGGFQGQRDQSEEDLLNLLLVGGD